MNVCEIVDSARNHYVQYKHWTSVLKGNFIIFQAAKVVQAEWKREPILDNISRWVLHYNQKK